MVVRRVLAIPLILGLLGFGACTAGAGEAGGDAPTPAGQVTFPSGRTFLVELAVTPEEQARGYMGRREIRPDEGILFYGEAPRIRRFWMKNCLVPIDMIWLDRDYRVLAIEPEAPPCKKDPCPRYGPSMPSHHVLEVRGGVAAEEGLSRGDRLEVVTDQIPRRAP